MSTLLPLDPSSLDFPLTAGTRVSIDDHATFIDRDLVCGGSPWRLLRLTGVSRVVAERWRNGGVIRPGEERFARTLVRQGLLHPLFDATVDVEEIDVVVPIFSNVTSLRRVLGELTGFHVTVVDDGSKNAAEIRAYAEEFDAKLIRLSDNLGPASARNAAARALSRRLLWFIDVDVSVKDPFAVAQRLVASLMDPLVAAVAPRVTGADGPSVRERFEHHFGPLDMGDRSGLVVPGGPVSYVPSACLMVRRAAFEGGFDETLRVGEDVDFVWRLHDQGWLVRYDAATVVTHRARESWSEWWQQRQRYGASSAELAKRHGDRLAPLRCDAWTLVAWISVLAGQPAWGARIVRAARSHARDRLFVSADDPEHAANDVVTRNMIRAGGPLARGVVRTFGGVILVLALHPRLRTRALLLFALGSAWRWRHQRPRVSDLPLGVADDLAYGVGVVHGAWRARSLRSLMPVITRSSLTFKEVVGLSSSAPSSTRHMSAPSTRSSRTNSRRDHPT